MLLDLAARCEAATGPDRELDRAIELAIFPDRTDPCPTVELLAYTASLDAAMTLVPEGGDDTLIFWRSGNDGDGGNPDAFKAEILVVTGFTSKSHKAVAATEALARSAAALRARNAEPKEMGE